MILPLWDIRQCRWVNGFRLCQRSYSFHLWDCLSLDMKALRSFRKSVTVYHSTQY